MSPPMLAVAAALICATGCVRHQPGSFQSLPGRQATAGCLDVALAARYDSYANGPVLELSLGNRCKESVWVDVSGLELTIHGPRGVQQVFIRDPRSELKPALLGGHEQISEDLELVYTDEATTICVNLSTLVRLQAGPPQTLCTTVRAVWV